MGDCAFQMKLLDKSLPAMSSGEYYNWRSAPNMQSNSGQETTLLGWGGARWWMRSAAAATGRRKSRKRPVSATFAHVTNKPVSMNFITLATASTGHR